MNRLEPVPELEPESRASVAGQPSPSSFFSLPAQARAELHYHRGLLFQAEGRLEDARAEIEEAGKLVEVPSVRRAIEEVRASLEGEGVASE